MDDSQARILVEQINRLAERLESRFAALGDGVNDLEMLQVVGLPIAMANSVPEILAAAAITIGSNQEDAAADLLRYVATR